MIDINLLKNYQDRLADLGNSLSNPEINSNSKKLEETSREYKLTQEIVDTFLDLKKNIKDLNGTDEMINSGDEEMIVMAQQEKIELEAKNIELNKKIELLLIPKDPMDDRDIILEIRSGVGGDEAELFAGDLLRMYTLYCQRIGLKIEIIDINKNSIGGIKEVVCEVKGNGAYGLLKFENGVHRVQRVPETEKSGRVHTSAASVLILPEAEDVDISINQNDLRIDTFCSSGAGGQSVNTTYSAVRITHLPTNTVVSCQDERSQSQNKEKAMIVLKSRLLALEIERKQQEESKTRQSIGHGDRSDKIRTYNFPQDRVTDHRIKMSLHGLTGIMAGQIDEFIDGLKLASTKDNFGDLMSDEDEE